MIEVVITSYWRPILRANKLYEVVQLDIRMCEERQLRKVAAVMYERTKYFAKRMSKNANGFLLSQFITVGR